MITIKEIKEYCKDKWLTEIDDVEAQDIYNEQEHFFNSYWKQNERFYDRWINNKEHIKYVSKY